MVIETIISITVTKLGTKSLYISDAVSNFYGTEIEIRADFEPVGNTEKFFLADYEQLFRRFFHIFMAMKRFRDYILICSDE